MNRNLVTVLISVGALIVGGVATGGFYEIAVVPPWKSTARLGVETADSLYDSLVEVRNTVDACQQTVSDLHDLTIELHDAYQSNRDATDDFFTRYNYVAGDASYLYSQLYEQDDSVRSAESSYLTSQSFDECYAD